jgi:hypothetical protein
MTLEWNEFEESVRSTFPVTDGNYFVMMNGELIVAYFSNSSGEFIGVGDIEVSDSECTVWFYNQPTHWAIMPLYNSPI